MNTKTWVITVGGVVCAPLLLGVADTSQQKTPSKLMKSQRISKKAKTIFYKVALAWDLRNHVRAIFFCQHCYTILQTEGEKMYVFDYSKMHPVTGEAACSVVKE